MRNRIAAVAAALTMLAAPLAVGATTASAEAAQTRLPTAQFMKGPLCRWNNGDTAYRYAVINKNRQSFTQFRVIRRGDVRGAGKVQTINVPAGERRPIFLSIKQGGDSGKIIVRVPTNPRGERLVLREVRTYDSACELDTHEPSASIDATTGRVTLTNAGDFIEKYRVSWTNGGVGSYTVLVPAGASLPFQPFIHGETAIHVYDANTDRLLAQRVVVAD